MKENSLILLHQHLLMNTQRLMQFPNHLKRQFPFAIQDFTHSAFEANDLDEIFLLQTHLLHSEFDSLNWIRLVDRECYVLIVVNKDRKNFKFTAAPNAQRLD